ncbi:hypothetical protein [Nonomuraea sp. SYSU D8015]|uniref:hypothetical protein n=1 Tax=Nonomuraea sp. SYSU D8015 TaxID=2593644 RepID=UPI0016612038|nr:hypothetical protein [Nonomuraea sp. SYSU D8015]
MLLSPRRIATAAIIAGGMTLFAAPASHAIVDPIGLGTCLAGSATDLTTIIDPTAPGIPAELPAVACLHP